MITSRMRTRKRETPLISVSVLLVELEKDGAQSVKNTSEKMVMLIIIKKIIKGWNNRGKFLPTPGT